MLDAQGRVLYVNAALENALGLSRRMLLGLTLLRCLATRPPCRPPWPRCAPGLCPDALRGRVASPAARTRAGACAYRPSRTRWRTGGRAAGRFWPRRTRTGRAPAGAGQANKELIRNLAHEIKNPLGGIRGAAQLLQMELASPELAEYTQVIIHEADRLQHLVDRLLAPHRQPRLVGDVNIHEVCEHVCRLVLAEHPRGLVIQRDYDTLHPRVRGDRAQLIQALLNIAQNAARR